MSTYVVGDIQGCFYSFQSLLEEINFSENDELWLVGDIINIGPYSLETLQWVFERKDKIKIVPGNHELNFLCCVLEIIEPREKETIEPILDHPKLDLYVEWIRSLPYIIERDDFLMSHAGVFPTWKIEETRLYSQELQSAMMGKDWKKILTRWKEKFDKKWNKKLKGVERYATLLNIFTKMRYLNDSMKLNKKFKGPLNSAPLKLSPWFQFREEDATPMILFGHWSTLGPHLENNTYALDSGCIWGGKLSALRLEDLKIFQVPPDKRDV